jgi:hypothetical protein
MVVMVAHQEKAQDLRAEDLEMVKDVAESPGVALCARVVLGGSVEEPD